MQRTSYGHIDVLGQPAGSKALRSRVGYVTQAPSVYVDITVRENVHYFGSLHGRARQDADPAIQAVDLQSRAHAVLDALTLQRRTE